MKAGDKVVKDESNWIPNEFDSWGRGEGVGVIVEVFDDGEFSELTLDVRWPTGKCYENKNQIKVI